MAQLSEKYLKMLKSEVMTMATCFRVQLTNGRVMAFTTLDKDVYFEDEPYLKYSTASASKTAFAKTNSLTPDNIDVTLLIDHDSITERDMQNGVYDGAEIEVFRFDYTNKPYYYSDKEKVSNGVIGDIVKTKNKIDSTFLSNEEYLKNVVTNVIKPTCPYVLGGKGCRKDLTDYTFIGKIKTVLSSSSMIIDIEEKEDKYFDYGIINFKSGLCKGLSREINRNKGNEIYLELATEYEFKVGDDIEVIAGCNKTEAQCKTKFLNFINFGGFPDVPGNDVLTSN